MKYFLISLLTVLSCTFLTYGQKNSKTGFYVIPQAGLLNGDKLVSAQVTIAGGIEHNGWGIGIASGIDYYKIRSVPLVLDIRKNISVANRPFLMYMNAGFNITAPLENQYRIIGSWWNQTENRYKNGLYGEAGIGYRFFGKTKQGLVLSLGFTTKTIRAYYMEKLYSPIAPYPVTQNERKLNYTFNRVILKLGYRL